MATAIPLKLGPHHLMGGSSTGQWLKLAPAVAKAVDDLGALSAARPGTLTIGRCVDDGRLDGQGFDMNRQRFSQTAEQAADQYVAFLSEKIRLNPWVQMWEGPNEQVFVYDEEKEAANPAFKAAQDEARQQAMVWYAEFLYQFAARLHNLRKRAAVGSWSTGNPRRELNLLRYYGRALQACQDFDAVVTRHDYSPMNEPGGLRIDYDQVEFEKLGYHGIQQVVTEGGMDSVNWVAHAGGWRSYYGSMDRYWNELLKPWLDAVSTRPYCLGVCLFTDGGAGGWKDFDIDGTDLVDRLAAYTPPDPGTVVAPTGDTHADLQAVRDQVTALAKQAFESTKSANALLAQMAARLPRGAHVWAAGDVALAAHLPLVTYSASAGSVHDVRLNATYDLTVLAASDDQLWLQVAASLWVKAADVWLKG